MPSPKPILLLGFLLLLPTALALDAPVVTSTTHQTGEWGAYPIEFRWQPIEGAKEYCYVLSSSSEAPEELPECTINPNAYPAKKMQSSDYYFFVKAVSLSGESEISSYVIKLDVEGPTRVTLAAEVNSDGLILLSWGQAEDDASGVQGYEIYRSGISNFDIRGLSATKIAIVEAPSTGFVDTNATSQSTTYHYKLRPLDKVGNPGSVSNEVHATTPAKCDLDIDFTIGFSQGKGGLSISLASSDKIYRGSLSAALPGGAIHEFFPEAEPFTEWHGTLDFEGISQGYIDFTLAAEEMFGDDCSQEKRFIYDLVAPELSFVSPKYNDRVSESVPIVVKVEDKGDFKSGIGSVAFLLKSGDGWAEIGVPEESEEGSYALDWDSFSVENGSQKIKAVAVDAAGNSAEAMQTITVLNAFESAIDLNAALGQAASAKAEAIAVQDALSANSIFSGRANAMISDADSNFAEAERLAGLSGIENETNAKMLLAQAILLYGQSKEAVLTSVYQEAEFVFNREQAGILFNAAGFSGQMAEEALKSVENYGPKRKLQILEVNDLNSTYYRALIVVSFALDANILKDANSNDLVMKLVEAVPKQFAEYASELDSNVSFDVLNDDPLLSFPLTKDEYRKKQVVYALKKDLSKEQADAMMADSIVNKFVAPPALISIGTAVPQGFLLSVELLAFLAGAIILVAVVLALAVVLRKKKALSLPKPQPEATAPASPQSKSPFAFEEKQSAKPPKPGLLSGIKKPSFGKKNDGPLSVFGKKS